jgi:hypothetical protein
MVNYSNGKIYKLVTFQSDKVYYGSTCSPLSKRLAGHRRDYKHWKAGKRRYITSFDVVQYEDTEIVLVESINCVSKEQLYAAERKYIDSNTCVNKQLPGRSVKEYGEKYYQCNREKILKYQTDYRKDNKKAISIKQKEKILCECGTSSSRNNISTSPLQKALEISTVDCRK